MDQIETLNQLGMVDPSDPNYQPVKGSTSWDTMILSLEKNQTPKAQALAKKFRNKYNLTKVESLNTKGNNNMEDTKVEETPSESILDKVEEATPPVSE